MHQPLQTRRSRATMMARALLMCQTVLGSVGAGWAADPLLVLENAQVSLRFDAQTGAWVGLVDRQSGDDLVVAGGAPVSVAPAPPPVLDSGQVARAVAASQALDLAGQWLYTPTPPPARAAADFLQGRFELVPWVTTPVPSRRGAGDDRLHDRTGDFWYRREIRVPAHWPDEELALVVGAIDDFDEVWVGGQPIGRTGVETPQHWRTPRVYRLAAGQVPRERPCVLLVKVTNGGFDGGIDGPVALGLASQLSVEPPVPPPLTHHDIRQESGAAVLRMTASDGNFEYQAEFTLPRDRSVFTRRLSVTNRAADDQLFQTMSYVTPPVAVGADAAVIFPGSLPVGDTALLSLSDGLPVSPRSSEPLAVLWSEQRQRGMGVWFYCEEEYSPVSVRRVGRGASVGHRQNVIIRLQPGETVTLGLQSFWLTHGSRDAVLGGVLDAYRAVGLRAPPGPLDGLRGMTLYCGHPGGPPELGFLRYGGFPALTKYVPTLERMHIDLLWLLPTWEHGDGTRWNLYAPFDHFQVDHLLGTADDLRALSRTCEAAGIRLMFDMVPHGPPDFTPLAKEHPEWAARQPDGRLQYEWGQLAFDNHHPGWQDYMRRAAEWNAREFGAVGARVDCAAGGPLNWNPEVTNRPSLSSLAAGLGMNRAIRQGYARVHPGVVLLPEEYTGANIFCGVGDLTYDAQLYFLQADLLDRDAPPEQWARAFQQFLHDQALTLPPGALKMR
ncbi:MAG: alpha-amylase family glycosyl hydrolase, partial [Pirellulaceae bacterium]|nr:alpha-amylase family glycosyl hydrolase [Pirellulaceae bacterium]